MIIERLAPHHLLSVQLQPAQTFVGCGMTEAEARAIAEQPGVGWAAVEGSATIACGGIAQAWESRGIAWMMLSDAALRQFTPIHRMVKDVLARAPWRRIEMTVDVSHIAGCRWAERLGFVREGRMQAFTRDGRDCYLYAKVK